jgi:hypothetical protein
LLLVAVAVVVLLATSGGGGAGGLIFMPGYPVTPGGTVTVTVGCGGAGSPGSPVLVLEDKIHIWFKW